MPCSGILSSGLGTWYKQVNLLARFFKFAEFVKKTRSQEIIGILVTMRYSVSVIVPNWHRR